MSDAQSNRIMQRRRIIKAAVSAPVIYTLANGAAAAAASLSCGDDPDNFLNLTEQELADRFGDSLPMPGDVVSGDDQDYVYLGDGDFVTGSCWTSVNPSTSAAVSSSRIV